MIDFENKNCLIIGFGRSGQGAFEALKKLKANISVYDKDFSKIEKLECIKLKNIDTKTIENLHFMILSPGVKLSPKIQKLAIKNNVEILSELELGSRLCNANIIAVTGTNGKTTTSMLLKSFLDLLPQKAYLLGNIGQSFSKFALDLKNEENVILECSSFQLMNTIDFHPKVACLLNLKPDHLDFHQSLEEYYDSKMKIFANQTPDDFAVVNYDDELCRSKSQNIKSKVFFFSTKNSCKGLFVKDDAIYFSDEVVTFFVEKLENIRYIGEHNLSNILCTSLGAFLCGVSLENISYVLRNFKQPSHRIEFVRRLRGVDFYDDSKATNISACVTACKAFSKNIHLLLGGSEKGENLKEFLAQLPSNVKCVYTFGQVSKKLYKTLKKSTNFSVFNSNTLKQATDFAFLKAKSGEIVLLSPGFASFDAFKNFEERGNYFKNLVNDFE